MYSTDRDSWTHDHQPGISTHEKTQGLLAVCHSLLFPGVQGQTGGVSGSTEAKPPAHIPDHSQSLTHKASAGTERTSPEPPLVPLELRPPRRCLPNPPAAPLSPRAPPTGKPSVSHSWVTSAWPVMLFLPPWPRTAPTSPRHPVLWPDRSLTIPLTPVPGRCILPSHKVLAVSPTG